MNNEQIIEKLKSLGFILSREYFENEYPDSNIIEEDETDSYVIDLDNTHNYLYGTNYITEWQSDGCLIFIDDDMNKYVNLEDFEMYLKIVKTN
jgi:hypothetical protein